MGNYYINSDTHLGFLDQSQIDYVLYHLSHHCMLSREVKDNFVFLQSSDEIAYYSNSIIFLLSTEDFHLNRFVRKNEIPILFSVLKNPEIYSVSNGNIVFNDDLLKSAFYLLSGYQEYISDRRDVYGRFPFSASVQRSLDMIYTPVVNHYFSFIIDGISEFCTQHHLQFEKRKMFDTFGFLLSHDIDHVDEFIWAKTFAQFRTLIGLKKNTHGVTPRQVTQSLQQMLKCKRNRVNTYWNFEQLRDIERQHGIVSSFYFLNSEGTKNARYSFTEERLQKIFRYLLQEHCEIGIHGTYRSAHNFKSMQKGIDALQHASRQKVSGIRQHYLKYDIPRTAVIQKSAGLQYDTTLGFPEHDGFRNSYCHPFKLYDFEKKSMVDIWEFPLMVMDTTLLYHRQYTYDDAEKRIDWILNEVVKFNGIFTLLWHNSSFDEGTFPSITQFYESLIGFVMSKQPVSLTGKQLADMLK